MQNFYFYLKLGLNHVLDLSAYDHMLFLVALALPFTFKSWRKVLLLATIFTIAHCCSLYLSAFDILVMDVRWIEFLIPLTILATAVFNLLYVNASKENQSLSLHIFTTAFFGLIHGFGFSNYFKMLIAEEEEKLGSLIGFACGIEVAQVLIVLAVLFCLYICIDLIRIKSKTIVSIVSLLIILSTIPMLVSAFPK